MAIENMQRSEWIIFIRELLSDFKSFGAICPSSKWVADYAAEQVPFNGEGLILELGAGTGVITGGLLRRGIPPHRLIVVEQSPPLIEHLRKTYPGVKIIEGDAAEITQLLGEDAANIKTVVSSLPLSLMPPHAVQSIDEQLDKILGKGSLFIHVTYHLRRSTAPLLKHFTQISSRIVWLNFPPACVNVLEHQ